MAPTFYLKTVDFRFADLYCVASWGGSAIKGEKEYCVNKHSFLSLLCGDLSQGILNLMTLPRIFALCAAITVGTATVGSASMIAGFDFGNNAGGTSDAIQTGFTAVTGDGTFTTGDGISVEVSGFNGGGGGGRERGTSATTMGGVSNSDDQVPEGVFSALYSDFLFGNANVTYELTGLDPSTEFEITIVSYDSATVNAQTVLYDAGGPPIGGTSFVGDLFGAGADPFTDQLVQTDSATEDYTTVFNVTSDATGAVTIGTTITAGGNVFTNGLVVSTAIPEPTAIALLGLAVPFMVTRRRK